MRQPLEPCCCCRPRQAVPISRVKCAEDVGNSASFWPSWNTSVELVELPDYHWRSAVPIFDIAGSESGPEVFIKMMYVGFWPSPLSRGRRYNCTSNHSEQFFNASSERYPWRFYSFIGYAEWHPLLLLLRLAKASERFYQPWGLSGMRTGPMLGVCLVRASAPQVR